MKNMESFENYLLLGKLSILLKVSFRIITFEIKTGKKDIYRLKVNDKDI